MLSLLCFPVEIIIICLSEYLRKEFITALFFACQLYLSHNKKGNDVWLRYAYFSQAVYLTQHFQPIVSAHLL